MKVYVPAPALTRVSRPARGGDLMARGIESAVVVESGTRGRHRDVRSSTAGQAARSRCGVDAVVHLGSVVSALDDAVYSAVNVDGTRAVVCALLRRRSSCRSPRGRRSASAARNSRKRQSADTMRPQQLDGERLVTSMSGPRWTILRRAWCMVGGPRVAAAVQMRPAANCHRRPPGRSVPSFTCDVVRAIAAAVAAPRDGQIMFVSHPPRDGSRCPRSN
jgi:hypothetical protein